MSEAVNPTGEGFNKYPASLVDNSVATQKVNQPEENLTPRDPLYRASPAGNRRLWEIPYQVLLARSSKSLRSTNRSLRTHRATSSRRRAQLTAQNVHDHSGGKQQHSLQNDAFAEVCG